MKEFKKKLLNKLKAKKKLNNEELEYAELVLGRVHHDCDLCNVNLMLYLGHNPLPEAYFRLS